MAHRLLRRDGHSVNHKRIRRLWREEGLRRPVNCRKRRRVRPDCAERLHAEHPNQVWALDFQFDETADGRRLKLLNVVDEHTREALAMHVAAPTPTPWSPCWTGSPASVAHLRICGWTTARN